MNGAITERELLSQPERWDALITRAQDTGLLPELELDDFDEIIVFGSGTSYYLALLLAELLELNTPKSEPWRVRALPSCELFLSGARYLTRDDGRKRLGIGISRSGESSEALLAADVLKAQGVPVLAIGCTAASTLPKKADYRLIVPEGHENGMVMMRSFTSMLLAFQLFLGRPEAYAALPAAGERIIASYRSALKTLANKADFRRFVVLGSGLAYPLALEAALKFQEMAIATSEAYHSLEYRHGPKSTAGEDTLVILFDPEGHSEYGVDLLRDLKTYDVSSLVIAETAEAYRGVADGVVPLESGLAEADRLALSLLPIQLLAFETAQRLGQNPDSPRNLSPVVKF